MTSNEGQNMYRMSNAFEFKLNAPALPGLATMGRFLQSVSTNTTDAASAALALARAPPPALCLACASTGKSVVIHNNNSNAAAAKRSARRGESPRHSSIPHPSLTGVGEEESTVRTLGFGQEPTALAAGRLNFSATLAQLQQQDALLFGAATSIYAYDVDQNQQCFYKDVTDGVNAVVCGLVATTGRKDGVPPPVLVVVGGNCSIFGFDHTGEDRYWTVTGDQVTAMMLLPWATGHPTAPPALVAASEDYQLCVFDGEQVVTTVDEVDRVRQLVPLQRAGYDIGENGATTGTAGDGPAAAGQEGRFACLLDNGIVGMYQQTSRVWRIKSARVPVSAAFCDVDCDGVAELVVGWDNGKVDIRSDLRPGSGNRGGEVLFSTTYNVPVAAVLAEDYRQDGRALPLVCTVDGTVRGLTLLENRLEEAEDMREAQVLEALMQRKLSLAAELASLEEQIALQAKGEQDTTMPEAGLEVQCWYRPNVVTHKLEIIVLLQNAQSDTVVHSCVLRSDTAAFGSEEESVCFYADQPTTTLVCPLAFPNDVAVTLHASVVVGASYAESFQIHEVDVVIPKFVMYQLPYIVSEQLGVEAAYTVPSGSVVLTYSAPLCMAAIESWLRRAFCIPAELSLFDANQPDLPLLHIELISVRDGSCLAVEVKNPSDDTRTVVVRGESMEWCGEVISALGDGVDGGNVAEGGADPVEVRCEFPSEMNRLQELVRHVDESNEVRGKLMTDMADAATIVKTLLIRAEDARLLGDIVNMKKTYASLFDVNGELMSENMKRVRNYEDLKASLKEVNSYIQHARMVRLGSAKAELVAACRNALKENRTSALIELIRTGSA